MNQTKQEKIEPGFIDKLLEMFKYRQILRDLKQDMEQKDGLSGGYVQTEGKYIVDQMLTFDSSYMSSIFESRIQILDADFQPMINRSRFENYFVAYNPLRCSCKTESDIFMNVSLWETILEQFCDRMHSQYGIVAIIRAVMIVVNNEIWKAFLEVCSTHVHKQAVKCKNRELQAEADLKKKK